MKRKTVITLIATITLIGIIGCGNKTDDSEPITSQTVDTTEQQEDAKKAVENVEPVATVEPTAEPTPEPTAEPTPTPEPVEEEETDIIELDEIMYAQADVNLRSGASTDFEVVGTLTQGQQVYVTGQSKSTQWYQIDINGETQYVSNKYLATTKIQTQSQSTSNTTSNTPQSSGNSDSSGSSGSTGKTVNGKSLDDIIKELGGNSPDYSNVPMQQDEWFHGDYTGLENYHAY